MRRKYGCALRRDRSFLPLIAHGPGPGKASIFRCIPSERRIASQIIRKHGPLQWCDTVVERFEPTGPEERHSFFETFNQEIVFEERRQCMRMRV